MATLRHQIATNVLTVTRFRDLLKQVKSYRPNDDLELIRKAYDYSLLHHTGQSRASGEPYLVHPVEVSLVLAEMKLDPVAIAAGLLHDSVEDTSVTIVDIRKEFGYQQVHEAVEARRKAGEQFLAKMEELLREKLKEAGIEAKVESRIKRLYSIHQKLMRQHITVDQIYDLLAVRIITGSVQDCYGVLGLIHNLWRPVPSRIKDFIAQPRPDFYQSLHTS